LVSHTKTGSIASDRTVSSQESTSIAMTVETMITTLDRIDDAVSVTTVCTPPTSFARRDWISPVRVAVKNRSGIFCRWA
jgi:hypothetical protein